LWTRSTFALQAADREAVMVIARVCCWDAPCPVWGLGVLRCGLDALAESLGLTTRNKSSRAENLNPNHV
jgi:hypothetical protein